MKKSVLKKRIIVCGILMLCFLLTSCQRKSLALIEENEQQEIQGTTSKPFQEMITDTNRETTSKPFQEMLTDTNRETTSESVQEMLTDTNRGTTAEIVQNTNPDITSEINADNANDFKLPTNNQPMTEYDALKSHSASIIMVGDILVHDRVIKSALNSEGKYDFTPVFKNLKDEISDADIALVNEEVIIGGTDLGISGYPCFNAPYELGDALSDAGFDVICQATNHAMDKGKKGLLNDLAYWDEKKSAIPIGIYDEETESQEIFVKEINGIKIAVLNYTYGTNGIALPADMPYAVNLLEESKVRRQLQAADALADFVIVCPHWGTEYRLVPDGMQEKWTKIFNEEGADLVIGTHPHVIEPVEMINVGQDDEMLVYYSLGNYVNWTSGEGAGVLARVIGGMAEITVTKSEDRTYISDYGVTALVTDLQEGFGGVSVYKLSDYTINQAKENLIVNQDPQFSYESAVALCDEVWGDVWE